jgi:catabolite regulation protein CreA
VFKDKVDVTVVEDPLIEGVALYLSDFRRSDVDKLLSLECVMLALPSQSLHI